MNEQPRYATIRDYLRVLREQRLLIAIIVIVFGGLALGLSVRQDARYKSTASLSVADESEDSAILGTSLAPQTTPEARAATTASLATSHDVIERVRRKLRLRATDKEISDNVDARAEARTNLVDVEAKSSSKQFAAQLANAFAAAVRDEQTQETRQKYADAALVTRKALSRLDRHRSKKAQSQDLFNEQTTRDRYSRLQQLAQFAQPVDIVEAATPSANPYSPKPARNTIIGLILGLTIALIVAFLRDALDRRFRGAEEIRDELHLPMIGHVREELMGRTMVSSNGRPPLDDEDLESFRIIRSNIEYLDVDQPPKTLLVTSGLPEEGKTTVSTALATAFAVAGKRVLLVECDLRRPTVAKRLGVRAEPGLTDYLVGRSEPADVVQVVVLPSPGGAVAGIEQAAPSFGVIAAGTMAPRPAELLGSKRFLAFLQEVSEAYDHVILDSSPLLSVGDTRELLPQVDGVVLCVRATSTTRDQARAAKAALNHFPDRPTGLIITGLKHGSDVDYGYYSYAYAYGATRS